jgi:hypothetical protein
MKEERRIDEGREFAKTAAMAILRHGVSFLRA